PTLDAAIAHGVEMAEQGADILDVGGESTRPGADSVDIEEELARVMPVVAGLAARGIAVSIDTAKPDVARAACAAGAIVVNDVTGLVDPRMAPVAAEFAAGVVVMHMQGEPRTMQEDPHYDDVVGEVRDFLVERARVAEAAGVPPQRIAIDPGIGFGKTFEHNLELLRNLPVLVETGYPVLLGASRKAFLGRILGGTVPAAERDP
ncbi:MAG: dihydropteroate synthase, partial [bacterium]|nr:dihydropteroate synthase [bacterium]